MAWWLATKSRRFSPLKLARCDAGQGEGDRQDAQGPGQPGDGRPRRHLNGLRWPPLAPSPRAVVAGQEYGSTPIAGERYGDRAIS